MLQFWLWAHKDTLHASVSDQHKYFKCAQINHHIELCCALTCFMVNLNSCKYRTSRVCNRYGYITTYYYSSSCPWYSRGKCGYFQTQLKLSCNIILLLLTSDEYCFQYVSVANSMPEMCIQHPYGENLSRTK